MIWVGFALVAAVCLGITEFLTKRAYDHFDAWTLSWARNIFALPIFYILLVFDGIPQVKSEFWPLLLIAAVLELIVGITFFFAIKLTPLSLVLPFTTLGTIFIIMGAYFINHEPLKAIYFLAFPLILLGAFFIQEKRTINWKQLRNHKSELGIAIMIFTMMLFGISMPVGDRLASASSTFFFLAVNFTIFVILLTPIFLIKTSTTLKKFKKHGWQLLAVGCINGIFLGSLWLAFANGPAGPVSAINNLSILVAILLAGTLLREKGILRRTLASLLMITGATLAVLG